MKTKVLHVYRTYFPDQPGGIQEVIRQISLATQPYQIESRIFALSPDSLPKIVPFDEGVVVRSKSWAAPSSCDVGGLDALLSFKSAVAWADIVHYHFPWPFADLLHFMAAVRKPRLMTYHSDIVKQRFLGRLYMPLMRRMLNSMDLVVATSPTYANTSRILVDFVDPKKLITIPLGMKDCSDSIVDESLGVEILSALDLKGRPLIFSLGVLRYYKGLHTLVEAAKKINGLVVIGGMGPEETRLKGLAAEKGISNVIFTGQLSHDSKITLLRNCSIFVLPSHLRSEAFGMVLIEASMFGRPMVTCEIGTGTSFVNAHGSTGFVVPPESPEALADAINLLLADDANLRKMGLAARNRYELLFSDNALGGSYAAAYNKINTAL